MRWYKRDTDEHQKPHVVELYQRHGLQGLFFWDRLNDVLAKHFDFWCPGCYKFKKSIFYAFFYPQISDFSHHRLIKKMLAFLNDEKIILSSQGKSVIYLHYPDIIKRADVYMRRCLKKAEEKEQECPKRASELTSECEQMSLYMTSKGSDEVRSFFENKRVKL